jgi:hypothetical protein
MESFESLTTPAFHNIDNDFFGQIISGNNTLFDIVSKCSDSVAEEMRQSWLTTTSTEQGKKLYDVLRKESTFLYRFSLRKIRSHYIQVCDVSKLYPKIEVEESLNNLFPNGHRNKETLPDRKLITLSLFFILRYCSKNKLRLPPTVNNTFPGTMALALLVVQYIQGGKDKRKLVGIFKSLTSATSIESWKAIKEIHEQPKNGKLSHH